MFKKIKTAFGIFCRILYSSGISGTALTGDVDRYVRACRECQARKKGAGVMETTRVHGAVACEKPWDRRGMDILGPFPL